jgi:protein ImuA
MPGRAALGHGEADAVLQGGLAQGAVHEVFAEGRHSAAATGFIAGLAQRVGKDRPLLWVRQDFAARESGALSMRGWREIGLDPCLLVTVHAPDVESALRTAADALACDALGAVVIEILGETRLFDLVASRRLTLAARASGVTGLLLRVAASPLPSTAETRWIVRPARSPPGEVWHAWGAPVLETQLVRNRHGQTGQWIMEWKCDECLFRDASFHGSQTHPQPVATAPADRPHHARIVALRRTG